MLATDQSPVHCLCRWPQLCSDAALGASPFCASQQITAPSLHCSRPIVNCSAGKVGPLWPLSVYGAGELKFSSCHQRSGPLFLHRVSSNNATPSPSMLSPGTRSHLRPTVESSPQSWLSQIRCCTVMWSEWGQNFCPTWSEVCCEAVSRNSAAGRANLSPPCLRGKPVCVLPMSRVWASHSPSVSPKGPPTSQGGLSLPHRTPGLGCPVCGSNCSLLSVGVPPLVICIFLWVRFQGHSSQTNCFSSLPIQLCVYLSYNLHCTAVLLPISS